MSNLPEKKGANRVAILKKTVFKGLTDEEVAVAFEFCKATKLNPFKREIWAIPGKEYTNKRGELTKTAMQLMTGFNGYLAIANAHPKFDGMSTELVKNEDGTIDYAETTVHRKDRKYPSVVRCYFKEFYKPGYGGKESQWDKQGAVMIAKCSKSHALREAFPQELGGLYTQEEMGAEAPKVSFEDVNQLNQFKDSEIIEEDVDEVLEQVETFEEANLKAEKAHNLKEGAK